MSEHPLFNLAKRFPQLLIPIEEGASKTQLYIDLVRRGSSIGERVPNFSFDSRDSLRVLDTPAGPVEALTLYQRKDFEHVVQALAYRCEPLDIPASMGAMTLIGLIDWGKVNHHKEEWLTAGSSIFDWPEEFKTFTKNRGNIQGTLVILSFGPYSAVTSQEAGRPESEWLTDSLTIRTFHELTHVVCRRLYPENENAIRDEVLADYVGLVAAYGRYDAYLARLFLGLDKDGVREGGRLHNYVGEGESIADAERRARTHIDKFAAFDAGFSCSKNSNRHFEALKAIESNKISL